MPWPYCCHGPGDWERFLDVLGGAAGELARAQDVQRYVAGGGPLHWDRKYEEYVDEVSAAHGGMPVVAGVVGVAKSLESLDDVAYGWVDNVAVGAAAVDGATAGVEDAFEAGGARFGPVEHGTPLVCGNASLCARAGC